MTRDFLVYDGERLTYRQHLGLVSGLAEYLATEHGITKGDRVAIGMRNYPEWVVGFWATMALGAIAVLVLREGTEAAAADLQRLAGAQLARFEVPEQIIFRDDPLPRTASGKVLQRELRDELTTSGGRAPA